jgi:ATP-dependent Clp protease ATP-binding subunit ClpA
VCPCSLQSGVDKKAVKEAVLANVRRFFKPEFLNRLDDIVVFDPLSNVSMDDLLLLADSSLLQANVKSYTIPDESMFV